MRIKPLCFIVMLGACGGGTVGGDGGGDDDDDDDDDDTIDATIDAPIPIDAAPDAPPPDAPPPDAAEVQVDCENIPQGPFTRVTVPNAVASEDLAFDTQGNLIGSNNNAIFKMQYGQAPQVPPMVIMSFRAGLRYTADGILVVANDQNGTLNKIVPDGSGGWVADPIMTNLQYPNGLTVDMLGNVYFSEHDGGRIWRVNPVTEEADLIADDLCNPNGLSFDPTYSRLYFGTFCGDDNVYYVDIDASGNPGDVEVFASGVGSGWLDGIGVDACGNVYVCDYQNNNTQILRITPDGQDVDVIVQAGNNVYMPNLQWGSGLGGWEPTTIYVPEGWDHSVYEIEIGVPSKPVPYP